MLSLLGLSGKALLIGEALRFRFSGGCEACLFRFPVGTGLRLELCLSLSLSFLLGSDLCHFGFACGAGLGLLDRRRGFLGLCARLFVGC